MIVIIKKKWFSLLCFVFVSVLLFFSLLSTKHKASVMKTSNSIGYVALIIDDFGNHGAGTEEMLRLGIPITAAVMPFQPFSREDANAAHQAGLEVIMHIPMEPERGNAKWLGPKGITCDLSGEEIQTRIRDGLHEVPWVVGMNNHMGSKATQDQRVMKNILEIVKEQKLFFIDSKTARHSVVADLSKQTGVQFAERDIFLDGTQNKKHIEKQMQKLAEVAKKKGFAVGIGHVGIEGGKATAEAIRSTYPILQKQGIKFIYISDLIKLLYGQKTGS